jgi:hypothetical protein
VNRFLVFFAQSILSKSSHFPFADSEPFPSVRFQSHCRRSQGNAVEEILLHMRRHPDDKAAG